MSGEVPSKTNENQLLDTFPPQIEFANAATEFSDVSSSMESLEFVEKPWFFVEFGSVFQQISNTFLELGAVGSFPGIDTLHDGVAERDFLANTEQKKITVETDNNGDLSVTNSSHVEPAHELEGFADDGLMSHPAMNVTCHNLRYYRNLMRCNSAPSPTELAGMWRGVNKGVATLAIDRQFIKEFYYVNGCLFGDNVSVCQVSDCALPESGWQPIVDACTGTWKRQGRFAVECPQGRGRYSHGLVLNYAAGGNGRDPSRRIWDQVVKLDDNHMLGRATVRIGLAKVPVAYFVLERIALPAIEAEPAPTEIPVLRVSAER